MLQGYAQHLVTFSVKKQEKNDMSDVEGREKVERTLLNVCRQIVNVPMHAVDKSITNVKSCRDGMSKSIETR